jgi:sugar transferase (PEP-CTERM/EpsH1 system associated)
MKIIWLNCNVLFPLNRGGNIRTFNILKKLKRGHEITYISYLDDSYMSEADIVENMKQCCSELKYIKTKWEEKYSLRFYRSLFQNLFSTYPYVISKYYSYKMKNLVDSTLSQKQYDVIICDFLFTSVFLSEKYRGRSILFQHNVESVIWERHFKNQSNFLKKFYLYLQWLKLFNYEKKTCRTFGSYIAVSGEDKKILNEFGAKSVHVIPPGVDTEYFKPGNAVKEKPYNMVFTGLMDWIPNEDAVVYFVRSIFPKIKKIVPQATFTIVGRNPTSKVRSLKEEEDSAVEITGTVDDVRPYIEEAAVYVVPIRIGGGTRLKIFEAMSMGKTVVSTSVGAEGLPLENAKNIIIADDESLFAECVIDLLKNPDKRNKIGTAARELMLENFNWDVVAEEFEKICKEFSIGK